MNKIVSTFLLGFGLMLTLASISCSPSTNASLRNEISGRGRMYLDSSNPYLAPNKFLSEEAKISETLKGFLSLKGAPEELEYEQPLLLGSSSLSLFYLEESQKYVLKNSGSDWIITGPFDLDKKKSLNN